MTPAPRKKYWFAANKFGFGWTPITMEGWVVVITYLVVNIVNFLRINRTTETLSQTFGSWFPEAFVLTFILIYICLKKGDRIK